MRKMFEVTNSFLLFGSGSTALVMIWVLVADYKLSQWAVGPVVVLGTCVAVFFIALVIQHLLKQNQ